jgi:hypothetical protein
LERKRELDEFYSILDRLKQKIGYRRLDVSSGNDGWPNRGVYFFFEEGETRASSSELRVTRVGTHALKTGSSSTLWSRLRQHQGFKQGSMAGGGNHRGSVFRKHVGSAIINKEGISYSYPRWEYDSSASKDVTNSEYEMEKRVSKVIGSMPFLWVNVDDDADPESKRGMIERNSIALLSNYGSKESLDPPSKNWLGRYSVSEKIRDSGLWNVNHVDEKYDSVLSLLEEQVKKT